MAQPRFNLTSRGSRRIRGGACLIASVVLGALIVAPAPAFAGIAGFSAESLAAAQSRSQDRDRGIQRTSPRQPQQEQRRQFEQAQERARQQAQERQRQQAQDRARQQAQERQRQQAQDRARQQAQERQRQQAQEQQRQRAQEQQRQLDRQRQADSQRRAAEDAQRRAAQQQQQSRSADLRQRIAEAQRQQQQQQQRDVRSSGSSDRSQDSSRQADPRRQSPPVIAPPARSQDRSTSPPRSDDRRPPVVINPRQPDRGSSFGGSSATDPRSGDRSGGSTVTDPRSRDRFGGIGSTGDRAPEQRRPPVTISPDRRGADSAGRTSEQSREPRRPSVIDISPSQRGGGSFGGSADTSRRPPVAVNPREREIDRGGSSFGSGGARPVAPEARPRLRPLPDTQASSRDDAARRGGGTSSFGAGERQIRQVPERSTINRSAPSFGGANQTKGQEIASRIPPGAFDDRARSDRQASSGGHTFGSGRSFGSGRDRSGGVIVGRDNHRLGRHVIAPRHHHVHRHHHHHFGHFGHFRPRSRVAFDFRFTSFAYADAHWFYGNVATHSIFYSHRSSRSRFFVGFGHFSPVFVTTRPVFYRPHYYRPVVVHHQPWYWWYDPYCDWYYGTWYRPYVSVTRVIYRPSYFDGTYVSGAVQTTGTRVVADDILDASYLAQQQPMTFDEAWNLLSDGYLTDALDAFAELEARHPFDAEAIVGWSIASALLGNDADAVDAMRKAVLRRPHVLASVPMNLALERHTSRLIARYEDQTRSGEPFTSDTLFMIAALRSMLDQDAIAYFTITEAVEAGDTDASTIALQSSIRDRMYQGLSGQ